MIHWLLVNVVPIAVRTATATLTAGLVGLLIIQPLKAHLRVFKRAAESLDPEAPYGVTEQLDELARGPSRIRGTAGR